MQLPGVLGSAWSAAFAETVLEDIAWSAMQIW
jgi:hypothetical protein